MVTKFKWNQFNMNKETPTATDTTFTSNCLIIETQLNDKTSPRWISQWANTSTIMCSLNFEHGIKAHLKQIIQMNDYYML